MSSPAPTPSDGFSVEIHLFACGHGDTLLIRFPGNKWCIVDCYLPEEGGIRQRFFAFVQSKGIEHLSFIFLTHPHFDHFHGMVEVVDYFTSDGRSLGAYCDVGLNSQQVKGLLHNAPGERAFDRLQDRLDSLAEANAIRFYEINEKHEPLSPTGFEDIIQLVPIAPSAALKRRVARSDIRKLKRGTDTRLVANALSLMLVLSIKHEGRGCNVLLAGDAGTEEIEEALATWEERAAERGRSASFDAVKVPHHGSFKSRSEKLCRASRDVDDLRIAAISVGGARPGLPDRRVVEDYLRNDWEVFVTTKPAVARRRNSILDLANRGHASEDTPQMHDIAITWTSDTGLAAEPDSARVRLEDLASFQTAG